MSKKGAREFIAAVRRHDNRQRELALARVMIHPELDGYSTLIAGNPAIAEAVARWQLWITWWKQPYRLLYETMRAIDLNI